MRFICSTTNFFALRIHEHAVLAAHPLLPDECEVSKIIRANENLLQYYNAVVSQAHDRNFSMKLQNLNGSNYHYFIINAAVVNNE